MIHAKLLLLVVFLHFAMGCGALQGQEATRHESSQGDSSTGGIVVTANPHATKAGADILREGGSAVDAAIAIEAVLSLVEPQSSGLGGGGFMMYFENATNTLSAYDGREVAPASVTENLFLNDAGQPFGFLDAKTSGISTGVPGIVSMLQLAHQDHGRLPWGSHFQYASQLARDGFAISPRLFGMIERFKPYIPKPPAAGPTDAFEYFYDANGDSWPVGHMLKNPEYVETLRTIAQDPSQFYRGPIAAAIAKKVQMAPRAGGLTTQDMSAYAASRQDVLCMPYKDVNVCGPPPPSSWVAIGMIMGLLDRAPEFSAAGALDPANWALYGEAQRLAYADRDRFVGDDTVVPVPVAGMLADSYLNERVQLISQAVAIEHAKSGNPWPHQGVAHVITGEDDTPDIAGTTHFVVVDTAGNVVSMTASVESIFGSTRMVGGMFLNNQLTDFSRTAKDPTQAPISNAAGPGKKPRSSMSPTIVTDARGEFVMATGSPGGNSIIAYTSKTLVGVLGWGMSPQASIDLPNMVARGDVIRIEKGRASQELTSALREFGYELQEREGENSGLSVVIRHADGRLEGGVDPRREGVVEIID